MNSQQKTCLPIGVLPSLPLNIPVYLVVWMVFDLITLSNAAADDVPNTQPNVVLIMADDLGYGDLACYGNTKIRTPVLDRLASEGVRLTSFYSGCTICTPSRMALLTGAYPPRLGWQGGVVGYGIKPRNGLAPAATTMAEVFKRAGYRTGLVGKWHLGDARELSPLKQGFDTAFYIDKSNNQTKKLWRGEELLANPFDNRRLTELFATEAIRFIRQNQQRSFFLYLPFSAPHFPAEAHPNWKDKSNNQAYGDVVEELDNRIGKILDTIAEKQLDQQTIVVFLSDNGVEPGQKKWASSAPYRGLKWSTLEGGNRVPCIVRWPARIPAGQTSDALIGAIDLLPTLAKACNISLPAQPKASPRIDGVDVLATLAGKKDVPHPRTSLLFWNGWATPQAIRVGEWKLFLDQIKGLKESGKGPVLIHLAQDPSERKNLSSQYPDRVKSMQAKAVKLLSEIKANSMSLGGPADPDLKIPKPAKWLE